MVTDYYEILQVHPRADADAIAAAYQRLRSLYDPARLDGAAEELILLARSKRELIDRAYATLSDPVLRANYDAELATTAPPAAVAPQPSSTMLNADVPSDAIDYRPLPPAHGQERGRDFQSQPVSAAARSAGRAVNIPRQSRTWVAPVVITVALLAVVVVASYLLTDAGTPAAPAATAAPAAATATPSPMDAAEALIPEAKQRAEANPNDSQAWIDYGNLLYDSVQVVREMQPDSALYQQRLPRWREASQAYSRALAIEPNNWMVRTDLGVSNCLYGVGTSNQSLVSEGIAAARMAQQQAPDDPRVLLNLGQCLVSSDPPQATEALEHWQRVITISPDSPLASQARLLITRYSAK